VPFEVLSEKLVALLMLKSEPQDMLLESLFFCLFDLNNSLPASAEDLDRKDDWLEEELVLSILSDEVDCPSS